MRKMMVIVDPDDPSVSDHLTQNQDQRTDLSRGLVKYQIQDAELAKKIAYQPVTVTLDLSLRENYYNLTPIIAGALTMVKTFTELLLKVKVINVEYVTIDNIVTFTPITRMNGELLAVYENPEHLSEYYEVLDLDNLAGYQVLSNNPLVRLVLAEEYPDLILKYIQGVALIPVGTNDNETTHYSTIVDTVQTMVESKRLQGYFSYVISLYSPEEFDLVPELANMWQASVILIQDNVIILKSEVDFGQSAESWFRYNVNLIRYGQFPQITVFGAWQLQTDHRGNEKNWYSSQILYASLLAYQRLEDEFLRVFTQQIKVNEDYSITLSIPTYEQLVLFQENLHQILRDGNWYMEPVKDLEDGWKKRSYLQTVDAKTLSMILPEGSDNILVFTSPAVATLDFDNTPSLPTENNEWGLRGLYDFSGVSGLYPNVPTKVLVPPQTGKIVITESESRPSATGPVAQTTKTVEVQFSEVQFEGGSEARGYSSYLFETNLKLNQEILEDVWSKGFLLNYWNSAYVKYRNPKSFLVIFHPSTEFLNYVSQK